MYQLSNEESIFLSNVRKFAQTRIKPEAEKIEWIDDHRKRFPWKLVEEASRLGLRTIGAPEEYGGQRISVPFECMIVEELSAADMGVAIILEQGWKIAKLIAYTGTKQQKDLFFERYMKDDHFLLAIAGTEEAVGSDRILPYESAKLGTSARLEKDEWVINGRKNFISNSADAKMFLVYAATDPSATLGRSMSVFMVPSDTPGVSIGTIEDKISQRIVSNASINFENCRVPKSSLLGEPNEGATISLKFLPRSRVGAAATVLGTARAAFELAFDYAKNRVQGGKPIIEHQLIAAMLADMASKLEAARSLTMDAAYQLERDIPGASKMSQMAKYFAAEVGNEVCLKALQVFGHLGIVRSNPIQKYLRDAISFYHSDGTQQIQLLKIMNEMKNV